MSDTGNLTVYSTLEINQARKESLQAYIDAYVDPAVYYAFQFAKTYSVPSETVVDGTDSGKFTPLAQFLLQNANDGNLINKLALMFKTEDIDGPSLSEPSITAKVTDLTNSSEIRSISFSPDGVVSSDRGTLTTVVFENIAADFPADSAVWEVSVSIKGNLSVKLVVGQQYYYSVC